MMWDIIHNLVRSVWQQYENYTFDPETIRLYTLNDPTLGICGWWVKS